MAMTTQGSGSLLQPGHLQRQAQGRIGLIVAGSLATGLVVALVLVAAPFPGEENVLTGMVLLAALGLRGRVDRPRTVSWPPPTEARVNTAKTGYSSHRRVRLRSCRRTPGLRL
jgi:hypothetical protein